MSKSEDFYKFFKIEPKKVIDCQYYNEFQHGISFGNDVCEHVDNPDMKCEDCEVMQGQTDWYAEITDDVVARLLWTCPVSHGRSFEQHNSFEELKEEVLDHVINYFKNDKMVTPKYVYVQEILRAHMRDMTRW